MGEDDFGEGALFSLPIKSINQIKPYDQDDVAFGYIKKSIFWLHLWVGHDLFHQESLS